jgi:hypothetical protein
LAWIGADAILSVPDQQKKIEYSRAKFEFVDYYVKKFQATFGTFRFKFRPKKQVALPAVEQHRKQSDIVNRSSKSREKAA